MGYSSVNSDGCGAFPLDNGILGILRYLYGVAGYEDAGLT